MWEIYCISCLDGFFSAFKTKRYDASRRVGVELPWHPMEDRELEPAEVESITLNSSGPEVDPVFPLNHDYHDCGRKSDDQPHIHLFFSGYLSGPNPISKGSLLKGVKLLPSQGHHHFPYECLFNMKDTTAVVWLERVLKQLKPWQWTTTIVTIGKCDRHDDFLSQGLLQMP